MPRRIQIKTHLNEDELLDRYRECTRAVERTRFQVIWLLSRGFRTEQIADVTALTPRWIRQLAKRYNEEGADGLLDGRRNNRGRKPLLDDDDLDDLRQVVDQPHAEGGPWTGPRVARWMEERLGTKIHDQRGWDYLKKIGRSAS